MKALGSQEGPISVAIFRVHLGVCLNIHVSVRLRFHVNLRPSAHRGTPPLRVYTQAHCKVGAPLAYNAGHTP